MKKNKGITLVALIITIVVMLILVAVSINILVNSNLIGHAEKTGDAYAGAIKNEENKRKDYLKNQKLKKTITKTKIIERPH